MSLQFTDLEWELADQAREECTARAKREGRCISIEEVAERIGELRREVRNAAYWRKRAKAAESKLKTVGIIQFPAPQPPHIP